MFTHAASPLLTAPLLSTKYILLENIESRYLIASVTPSRWVKLHFFIQNRFQVKSNNTYNYMGRVKRIWYLSPMRAAKDQASLRIRAVSPEPPLLAHTSSESRGTFRQKARSLAPLNGWACAVIICHDGMLEDTNLLEGAQLWQQRKHIHIHRFQHRHL